MIDHRQPVNYKTSGTMLLSSEPSSSSSKTSFSHEIRTVVVPAAVRPRAALPAPGPGYLQKPRSDHTGITNRKLVLLRNVLDYKKKKKSKIFLNFLEKRHASMLETT